MENISYVQVQLESRNYEQRVTKESMGCATSSVVKCFDFTCAIVVLGFNRHSIGFGLDHLFIAEGCWLGCLRETEFFLGARSEWPGFLAVEGS